MSSKAEHTLKRKEIKKQLIREGSIEKKRSGRRINENFGKRKRSLVRKSDEMKQMCTSPYAGKGGVLYTLTASALPGLHVEKIK